MNPVFIHAANPGPMTGAGNWTYLIGGSRPVLIDANVSLDAVGATSTDGVRVAVQHNGSELVDETLVPSGPTSSFATPIPLTVTAGDRIYFRAGAVDDGVSDSVDWQPVITYQAPS